VFLLNKKTCLLVQQDDTSSLSTTIHVFLLNKKTCILAHMDTEWVVLKINCFGSHAWLIYIYIERERCIIIILKKCICLYRVCVGLFVLAFTVGWGRVVLPMPFLGRTFQRDIKLANILRGGMRGGEGGGRNTF